MLSNEYLEELYSLEILDTDNESAFDNIVQLASAICNTDRSYITILDKYRQWVKASHGQELSELEIGQSFCIHAIQSPEPFMVVENPYTDVRFYKSAPVIEREGIRYYAGVPIRTNIGTPIGTLCVIHNTAHHVTDVQINQLQILAKQINILLHERIEKNILSKQKKQAEIKANLHQLIISHIANEIKTPIYNASGLLEYFTNSENQAQQLKTLAEISKKQLNNIVKLVDNLLVLTDKAVTTDSSKRELVIVKDLIDSIISEQEENIQNKGNNTIVESSVAEEIFVNVTNTQFILSTILQQVNAESKNNTIQFNINNVEGELQVQLKFKSVVKKSIFRQLVNEYNTMNSSPGDNDNTFMAMMIIKQYLNTSGGKMKVKIERGNELSVTITLPDVKFIKRQLLA